MPQVAVAAAAWIGSAVLTVTGSATIAAAAANFVAAAGFAQGIGAAVGAWSTMAAVATAARGKPRIGDQGKGTQVDFKADPNAGIPYAIGQTGVGGSIVFATTTEAKNQHLLYLTVLSGAGPIEQIVEFRANDQTLTFTADNADQEPYHNFMASRWQLGSQTPAVFDPPATTLGALPEWTSSHKLTGYAAHWWVLEYDTRVYPAGTPKPLTILKGVKVYDPRKDSTYPGGLGAHRSNDEATWEWSENPFLHALTWCLGRHQNGKRILGVGAPVEMIDVAAFVEGANVADANGWKIGGVVYSTDDKWQVLAAMLAAGGGWPTALGAKISCGVNTPRVSLATLTGADAVGEVSVTAVQSRRDRLNGAIPRYRSSSHRYELVQAAKVTVPDYVTADDGEDLSRELDFPLCPDVDQAAQLATYAVCNSREFGPIIVPAKPKWRGYRPNDCITLDEAEWGLNGQKAVILGEGRDPQTGVVTLTLQSETDDKHDFSLGKTGTPPASPGLSGFDPLLVDPPGVAAFAINGATFSGTGGDIPGLIVEGASDNAHAAELLIRYKPNGGADWVYWPPVALPGVGEAVRVEITGVTPETTYEVETAYRSPRGVPSAWTAEGTATAGQFDVSAGVLIPSANLWRKQDYIPSGGASSIDPAFGVSNWGFRFGSTAGAVTVSGKIFANRPGGLYSVAFRTKLTTGTGTAFVRVGWRDAANNPIADLADQVVTVTTADTRYSWDLLGSDDVDFVNAKFVIFTNAGDVAVGKVADVADIMVVHGGRAPSGFSPCPDDPEGLRLFGFTGELNADLTATHTSAAISGQGALATQNAATWSTQVTGTGKPENGADVTATHTAAAISGQGSWATASVPPGLTPTIVGDRTQYIDSTGQIFDYRGLYWGYSVDGVAGRATDPLTSTSSAVSMAAHTVYLYRTGYSGGYPLSVPAATFSGLTSDKAYTVFYRPQFGDSFCPESAFAHSFRASPDGYMEIGAIRTATGAGTYVPPGESTPVPSSDWNGSYQRYTCVAADAVLASGQRAGDAAVGDPLTLMSPAGDRVLAGEVEAVLAAEAECLTFRTALGAVLTVSDTTPMMTRKGPGFVPFAVRAAEAAPGLAVPILTPEGDLVWDVVESVEPAGRRPVALITAKGIGVYAASDAPEGPKLFTHNAYNKVIP